MIERKSTAEWQGGLKKGNGKIRLASGAYEGPYSFESRFEQGGGTNPEELIAAAHAGCFSMAFSKILSDHGHEPEMIQTSAIANLEKKAEGFAISAVHLETEVKVDEIEDQLFQRLADDAKSNCPVSMALAGVMITLKASLIQT